MFTLPQAAKLASHDRCGFDRGEFGIDRGFLVWPGGYSSCTAVAALGSGGSAFGVDVDCAELAGSSHCRVVVLADDLGVGGGGYPGAGLSRRSRFGAGTGATGSYS